MRKIKKMLLCAFCLMMTVIMTGCSLTDSLVRLVRQNRDGDITITEAEHGIYCIRTSDVGLVKVAYDLDTSSPDALIESCIEGMKQNLEDDSYRNVLSGKTDIVRYDYDSANKLVVLYFNDEYKKLPPSTEILVRAAVVKTLTQFSDKIQYVSIGVDEELLVDKDGVPLRMCGKDFVSNIGGNMEYVREDYVTLYFLSEDGQKLQPEDVVVKYLSKINLETAVVNSLIAGPIKSGVKTALSPNVVVNKVYVKEGICYVDLNDAFFERSKGQPFELNIYSVVNSLTQLSGINRVQFLIDGEIYTDLVDGQRIDTLFEKNMSLVNMGDKKEFHDEDDILPKKDVLNKDIEQQLKENHGVKDTKAGESE